MEYTNKVKTIKKFKCKGVRGRGLLIFRHPLVSSSSPSLLHIFLGVGLSDYPTNKIYSLLWELIFSGFLKFIFHEFWMSNRSWEISMHMYISQKPMKKTIKNEIKGRKIMHQTKFYENFLVFKSSFKKIELTAKFPIRKIWKLYFFS